MLRGVNRLHRERSIAAHQCVLAPKADRHVVDLSAKEQTLNARGQRRAQCIRCIAGLGIASIAVL